MADSMITVASFADTTEAALAQNRLQAAGIRAFLADAVTVSMLWHLTNAIGGVKLEVAAADAEAAREILAATDSAQTTGLPAGIPDSAEGDAADDVEPVATGRENDAERAFRGAVIGLLFFPLQFYVFWLLLKVFVSDDRLSGKPRTRAWIAAAINIPVVMLTCLWMRALYG